MIQKFIFLSILSLLFTLFSLYFYYRVLNFFTKHGKRKLLITAVLIAWEAGFVVVLASSDFWYIRALFDSVLGFLLFALLFGLCIEFLNLFKMAQKAKYPLLILFTAIFALSIVNGSKEPVVKNVTVHTKYKQLKGIKAVFIADAHIDPSKQEFAKRLVKRISDVKPDLMLIVGDLSDGKTTELKSGLDTFKNIKPKYGTFFVPGNHEYYYADFREKMDYLGSLGMVVLENTNKSVTTRFGEFTVAGVTDIAAARANLEEPNPQKAMLSAQKPLILLAHQPKTAKEALIHRPDFVFCGHTHDGQIWPFRYIVSLVQPYVYGEYKSGNSDIFVTSGAGVWGPPMRLFSQSEIVVVSFI